MKILFLSEKADCINIAYQLQRVGHEIKVFVRNSAQSTIGDGIIDRVDSWRPYLKPSELVIVDGHGFGHRFEDLRGSGRPVIGCSLFTDLLAESKKRSVEIISKLGLLNVDHNVTEFESVRVEGWWNGRSWVKPFFLIVNHPNFFPGNMGQEVDDMGSVVVALKSDAPIIDQTLMKLEGLLKQQMYRGPISMKLTVSQDTITGEEILSGFIQDGFDAFLEGLRDPLFDTLFEVAQGVKKHIQMSNEYLVSVRYSLPPWPNDGVKKSYYLVGVNEKNEKHIKLNDVNYNEGAYQSSGHSGVLFKATARGQDMREALRRVYRTLSNVNVPEKQYRLDIGEKFMATWQSLKTWGWI